MGAIDTSRWPVVAPLVVLVAIGASLALRGARRAHPRGGAATWPVTRGTILSSTIQVLRTGTARHEVPIVRYSYQVGREVYQGSRIRAGGDTRTGEEGNRAREVLTRYPVGTSVHVFYDPADPTRSALER